MRIIRLFILYILLGTTTQLCAAEYDFLIGGIYYRINSISERTLSVVSIDYKNGNTYSGDIVIPETINYNGQTLTVTELGNSAFENCVDLLSISIPASVIEIRSQCFYGCKNLKRITFLDGVSPIHVSINSEKGTGAYSYMTYYSRMFSDCKLNTVYIGRNITYDFIYNIPRVKQAYPPFSNIENVTIGHMVDSIGYYFFENTKIKNIKIADNSKLHKIGEKSFRDSSELLNFEIPSTVDSLGTEAFQGCIRLKTISIPANIKFIGQSVFMNGSINGEDADSIRTVYSFSPNPIEIYDNVFGNSTYVNGVLYVPTGSRNAYLSTKGWRNFFNIQEMTPSSMLEIKEKKLTDAIIYNINGMLSNKRSRINIIKFSDGTIKKVLVK